MRKDILNKKKVIISWILENKSKAYICLQLGCKQDTLNGYLIKWGVDYIGNKAGVGLLKSKIPLEDILNNKVKFSRCQLKKRLLYEGLLEYKCVKCSNIGIWMGERLPLELDHINGVNNDNRLENLRFLCPNCHTQTETYKRKNLK